MSLAKAAAKFAEAALDPKTSPADRSYARKALAALGAVETPAPRIVRVETAPTPTTAEIAAKALAENPQLRKEWNRARVAAEVAARLSPREHELLARLDGPAPSARSFTRGNVRHTEFVTRAEASRLLSKLDDEMKGVDGRSRDEEERGRGEVDALVRKGAGDPIDAPGGPDFEQQLEDLKRRFGVK